MSLPLGHGTNPVLGSLPGTGGKSSAARCTRHSASPGQTVESRQPSVSTGKPVGWIGLTPQSRPNRQAGDMGKRVTGEGGMLQTGHRYADREGYEACHQGHVPPLAGSAGSSDAGDGDNSNYQSLDINRRQRVCRVSSGLHVTFPVETMTLLHRRRF